MQLWVFCLCKFFGYNLFYLFCKLAISIRLHDQDQKFQRCIECHPRSLCWVSIKISSDKRQHELSQYFARGHTSLHSPENVFLVLPVRPTADQIVDRRVALKVLVLCVGFDLLPLTEQQKGIEPICCFQFVCALVYRLLLRCQFI